MKKFFELSVVSRKNVKGEVTFKAKAISKKGESLGEAVIVRQDDENKYGIYCQYMQNEKADAKETIAIIEMEAKNKEILQAFLKQVKDAIVEKIWKDDEIDMLSKLLARAAVSEYIDVEGGRVEIPKQLDINITNEMLSKYSSDEWLGIELKFSKDIQDKIDKVIGEKEDEQEKALREEERKLQELRDRFNVFWNN